MSRHVYIANPQFKEDPIIKSDWITALENAADRNEDLIILRHTNKTSGEEAVAARLRKFNYPQITLDHYGLIHAQNPSRALIEVMFEIASELGLKVYSERLKPYQSPDDWEKRTRKYRKRLEEGRAEYRKKKRIRILQWLALFVGLIIYIVFFESKD